MAKNGRSRVLIVGGTGYLGARLASALCEQSKVVVTSRSLSVERKQWLDKHGGKIEWLLYDSAAQERLPVEGKFDCVINLAGPSAAEAARNENASCQQALHTVRACLDLIKIERAERLIHFSSFHVYGAHYQVVYREKDELRPTHPYGSVHLHCEQTINNEGNGQPIFIVRPTNIVGAPSHADLGVQASLVFLDLCKQAIQTRSLTLRSDGKAYRDFVAMGDALDAVTLLMSVPCTSSNISVMNLASGTAVRLADLAVQIQSEAQTLTSQPVTINFGNGSDPFSEPFHVTNDLLRACGWQPHNKMREEIRQTLEFISTQAMT